MPTMTAPPPLPTRERFIHAAALALAAAIRDHDEEHPTQARTHLADLRELAALLIEVVYDEAVMR